MQNATARSVTRPSNLIRLDLIRRKAHHVRVARKTVTAAYDPERLGFDLKEMLQELRETPGTVYFDRSEANLAGMLLTERAQEEVQRLRSTTRHKEVS